MNGLALCAGAGGLELGLRIAIGDQYRCVAYVERDAYAAACLVARMEDKAMDRAPIWDDLTTFGGASWRGKVDIISAGFPCQPWSLAGQGKRESDERWIWPAIADIVRDVRPQYVFLENVPGLIIRDGLSPVLGRLAEMGFNAEWCVISAAAIGATHDRQRAYILAYSSSVRPRRVVSSWQQEQLGLVSSNEIDAMVSDLFPPPIDDVDQWQLYDARGKRYLLPAVSRREANTITYFHGMADGFAFRADRLRLCGNGVVPLQAAAAFVELVRRIENVQ